MTVKINKPIYQTNDYFRVGIAKSKLETALKRNEIVRIITPDGEAIINPREALDKGEYFARTYLKPGEPLEMRIVNAKREKPIDSLQASLM